MIRTARSLLLVGLLAVPAARWAAPAPARYPIKLKTGGQGSVTQVDRQDTAETKFKIEGPDGQVLREDQEKRTTRQAYQETILERPGPDQRATRLERAYTRAVETVGDAGHTLSYQGQTVVIERKGGTYRFTVGPKELPARDAALLHRSFNQGGADAAELAKRMSPPRPVRVGQTWQIDWRPLPGLLLFGRDQDVGVDASTATATGKLLRAYTKGGRQFGVLDFHVELPLTGEMPLGKAKVTLRPGSKLVLKVKADTCIDGTSSDAVAEWSKEMKVEGVGRGSDGKDYKVLIDEVTRGKDTETDLSRK